MAMIKIVPWYEPTPQFSNYDWLMWLPGASNASDDGEAEDSLILPEECLEHDEELKLHILGLNA